MKQNNTLWESMEKVKVDTQKLELLFESKAKDINNKVRQS